ncbi:MAG: flippase [Gemmatimonadaceae bacterium]|nr:flippase [Gloeobacterales cyanobacterium ES-bin-141]
MKQDTNGSRAGSILLNASSLIAANFLTRIVTVPITALLLRTIDEQAFGRYSYLIAFVSIFSAVANLGLPNYVGREAVQQPERAPQLLKTAYLLQLVFSAVAMAAIVGVGGRDWLMVLSGLGMVSGATATLFLFLMNGQRRSYLSAGVQFIATVFNTLGTLFVIFIAPTVDALLWVYALTGVLTHILSYLVMVHYSPELKFQPGWPRWADYRAIFVESLPYVFLLGFSTLYFRVGVVLLETWSTYTEIALYSAAFKFVELVLVLVSVFAGVFFAEFSLIYAQGGQELEQFMRRGFRAMVLLSLPIGAVLSFCGHDILYLFYGSKYLASTPMLQVLAWTTIFLFARSLQTCLLQACNLVRIQALVFAGSSLLAIGLNWALIPRYGGVGAAVATLLCEAFNWAAFSYFLRARLGIVLLERWVPPAAIAFASMCAVLWLGPALWLRVILGPLVFGLVFWASGGIQPDDAALFKRLVTKLGLKDA